MGRERYFAAHLAVGAVAAVAFVALLLCAAPGAAFEMTGSTRRLESGSVHGGGGTSTAGGGSGNHLGGSIGQSQPVGIAVGASGTELRMGMWHTVATPVPEPGTGAGLAAAVLATAWLARARRRRPGHGRCVASQGRM